MTSIVDFIEARFADDEAAARAADAAVGSTWQSTGDAVWGTAPGETRLRKGGEVWEWKVGSMEGTPRTAEHIARHDPARVLREVESKRAILEDHQIKPATYPEPDDNATFGCERCHFNQDEGVYGFGYCPTLKALAAVYSDHSEYREEWAA